MPVSKEEVKKIADLAKLNFNEEELKSYTTQLNKILEYMEKLNELDTENVKPLSHPVETKVNKMREDKNMPSVSTKEALKNSPDHDDKFFKVPKVINQ